VITERGRWKKKTSHVNLNWLAALLGMALTPSRRSYAPGISPLTTATYLSITPIGPEN
jgi:hypothetical protein